MNREKSVIDFYVLTNKLKNVIRTGWLNWHVSSQRVESVAEHVYGVQMLALAMYSEYKYDVDIKKVIFMLAVHELEETIIGDLTFKQISSEDKKIIGHEAVEKILSGLLNGEEIKEIIYEFDAGITKEAKFAYHCDKLECDLQCKLYDEAGNVRYEDQTHADNHREDVMEALRTGTSTWSYNWMTYDRPKYLDDENFLSVLDYAIDNNISKED